jgi:hypothetical protein
MAAKHPRRFVYERHDDGGVLRVKVTCAHCGASDVGNADAVVNWQAEHQCVSMPLRATA